MRCLLSALQSRSLRVLGPDSRHAKPRCSERGLQFTWGRKEVLMYLLMLLYLISIRKRRTKLSFQISPEL
jgi:hypothetical protein